LYGIKNGDDIPWRVQEDSVNKTDFLLSEHKKLSPQRLGSLDVASGEREPSLWEETRKTASRQPYRAALLCGSKVPVKSPYFYYSDRAATPRGAKISRPKLTHP